MGDTIIRPPNGNVGFASKNGRVRPVDEDSVLAVEIRTAFLSEPRTRLLLMVADGMGGHSRGEVASRIAVQAVARTLLPLLASEKAIPQRHITTSSGPRWATPIKPSLQRPGGARSARGWGRR